MMKYAGLIGFPVGHSLSPQMHNAAFEYLGMNAEYQLWETSAESLPVRIAGLRESNLFGANITVPHKEEAIRFVDTCDELAVAVGAINVIVNQSSNLAGYNTDVYGFKQALLQASVRIPGSSAVILGSGGAARAAGVALLSEGASGVTFVGRNIQHMNQLLDDMERLVKRSGWQGTVQGITLSDINLYIYVQQANLVVNATPNGLKASDPLLLDTSKLPSEAFIMDMIFNPPMTPLLAAAKDQGCRISNGLSMLLYQGAKAFELWTGESAPVEVMAKAIGI